MKNQTKYKDYFTTPFNVATVVNNQDPENSYRVKVRIDIVHDNISDNDLPWAARVGPTFMGFGNADIDHAIPEVGTKVLTLFIANDPNSILYLGTLYKNNSATPSGDPYLGSYGIYTQKGEFIGIDKINYTFKMIYEGKLDISKLKEAKISVNGPMTVKTDGDIKIESGGNINIKSSGNMNIESGGPTNIKAGGTVTINSTGMTNLTGGQVTIEKGTQCGFNCLQKCILTNTPHVSPTSM